MTDFQYFNQKKDPKIKGVDDKTMQLIDRARARSGIPWTITSGLRSQNSNDQDPNAVKDSAHLTGQAVDVRCTDNHQLWCMLFGLMNEGARRIGIYGTYCKNEPRKFVVTHIHVDTDPKKPQEVVWIEEEK